MRSSSPLVLVTSSSLPLLWSNDDGRRKQGESHPSFTVRKNTGFHTRGWAVKLRLWGEGKNTKKTRASQQAQLRGRRTTQTSSKLHSERRARHGRAGRQHDRHTWRKKRARLHPGGFRAGAREQALSRTPRTINKKLLQRRR